MTTVVKLAQKPIAAISLLVLVFTFCLSYFFLARTTGNSLHIDEFDSRTAESYLPDSSSNALVSSQYTASSPFETLAHTDTFESTVTPASQQINLLLEDFRQSAHSLAAVDQLASELAALLSADVTLLKLILAGEYKSLAQKHLLLDSISYAAGSVTNEALRDYALQLSASSDYDQSRAGLDLLSSLNIAVDEEVRDRLLQFGQNYQESEVLIRVMATLSDPSDDASSKQRVVEFFNQMTQFGDETVRRLAIQRLAQWDQQPGTVSVLSIHSFNHPDPAVRAFSLRSLVEHGEVYPYQRDQLFAMVTHPNTDPMVRIAASEALDQLDLSPRDIQRINSALVAEDFELAQRH